MITATRRVVLLIFSNFVHPDCCGDRVGCVVGFIVCYIWGIMEYVCLSVVRQEGQGLKGYLKWGREGMKLYHVRSLISFLALGMMAVATFSWFFKVCSS